MLLLLSAVLAAGPLTLNDGGAGSYGVPYAWLGARTGPHWENYRKRADGTVPPYPSVIARNVGDTKVRYVGLRYGCTALACTYNGPGVFAGSVHAKSSTAISTVKIWGAAVNGVPEATDLRFGFAEDLPAAGFAQFVTNMGGDDHEIDLYNGQWGVDGVEMRFVARNFGLQWRLDDFRLSLVAALSPNNESDLPLPRQFHLDALRVESATFDAGTVYLAVPADQPLDVRWSVTSGAAPELLIELGADAKLRWRFDPTDPQNPDGIGFAGGSIDLDHVIPVMYVSNLTEVPVDPLPSSTLDLEVDAMVDHEARNLTTGCGCGSVTGLPFALLALLIVRRAVARAAA